MLNLNPKNGFNLKLILGRTYVYAKVPRRMRCVLKTHLVQLNLKVRENEATEVLQHVGDGGGKEEAARDGDAGIKDNQPVSCRQFHRREREFLGMTT